MKNRAYLPDPAKKPYRGFWCDVSCEYDDVDKNSDLCKLHKLFVDHSCTGGPPKKLEARSFWCDVPCESSLYPGVSGSCRTFQGSLLELLQRLNC